jgi:hypothetical protein
VALLLAALAALLLEEVVSVAVLLLEVALSALAAS